MDTFSPWVILDICGPFWNLSWAVSDAEFMGRFGRSRFGSWAVLVTHFPTNGTITRKRTFLTYVGESNAVCVILVFS